MFQVSNNCHILAQWHKTNISILVLQHPSETCEPTWTAGPAPCQVAAVYSTPSEWTVLVARASAASVALWTRTSAWTAAIQSIVVSRNGCSARMSTATPRRAHQATRTRTMRAWLTSKVRLPRIVPRTAACFTRADSRFAPNKWVMAFLCNAVSHWLGTSLESTRKVQASWVNIAYHYLLIRWI